MQSTNTLQRRTHSPLSMLRQSVWGTWFLWVLVTSIAALLGLYVARIWTYFWEDYFNLAGIRTSAITWNGVVGVGFSALILWGLVGAGQSRILALSGRRSALWLSATAVGGTLATVLFSLLVFSWQRPAGVGNTLSGTYWDGAIKVSVAGFLGGAILGIFQLFILWRESRLVGWWPLVSAISWGVALLIGGAISEALIQSGQEDWAEVAFNLTGYGGIKPGTLILAIYTAVTGAVLLWILHRRQP
jgi:hypothetical protein